jgi:uncharacterized protein (TIGR03437 family)
MKQIIRVSILLTILLLSIHTTESYVRIRLGGFPIAWNLSNPSTPIVFNGRVIYRLNSAGSDDVPFCEVQQAIAASFKSWEDIPTSTIAFLRGPDITSRNNRLGDFEVFWLEDSTTTDDGVDISGALAVTFVRSNAGEIIDAAMVFNGNEASWATNGRVNYFDIQQVATHEIGHSIGLDHSPNAASTMFPRTGDGTVLFRTPSLDDQIAASVIYPSPDFSSSTGNISGRVSDNSGISIFGAHIGVVDANGVAVAGVLSLPDGTYSIQGLPPGNYTIHAQPLGSDGNPFFNRSALSDFYRNGGVDTIFQTSPDFAIGVTAGATTTFDIQVIRGFPAFESYAVLDSAGEFFSFVGSNLAQGQSNAFVGVIGPGLPQSPLTISGPGITIIETEFGVIQGFPYIAAIVNVDSTAPLGPRNIVIDNGIQRTIVTGGVEILPATTGIVVVSQGDYSPRVAPESLAVAFGSDLATSAAGATCNPLPTSLAETSILIQDSNGVELPAPLMYVSPNQVNFQFPSGTVPGPATIKLIKATGGIATATINIQTVAPALYTADGTLSTNAPNGFLLRIRADGSNSYEPITGRDPLTNAIVLVPIEPGAPTDRLILALYGTGIRRGVSPTATIGGVSCQVLYAGPATLPGADQVNIDIDRVLIGRGTVDVVLTVDGQQANTVAVNIGGSPPVAPTINGILSQADYSPRVAPESLAAAFGSNLATSTASSGSNPLPTSLAGTSIIILDSGGTARLAPLMYVSPNQVNFQIAPGTLPGPATLTFRNGTGGTATTTINIQTVAPAIFTVDGSIPNGFAYRVRADGTGSYEPIARRDSGTNTFVPVPIDLGPATDLIILGVYGTGIRRGVSPTVTIGGVSCQVIFAGPTTVPGFDQMNIILDRSLIGRGLVDVVLNVDGQPSNTVSVSIQ